MAASNDPNPPPRADSGLSYVPAVWVAFVMAWAAYSLAQGVPSLGDGEMPDGVIALVYAGLAESVITLLWGLFLLGLVFGRSAYFPKQFIIWQVVTIVWLLAKQAYVAIAPYFVFSPQSLAITGAEIAVGLLCIYLLRADAGAEAVYANAGGRKPSVLVSLVAGLLGVIFGAALGFGGGLGAGAVIAEVANISCFEGGCGYFAFFIGLAGLLIGAVAGGILAVWWVNRRRKRLAG